MRESFDPQDLESVAGEGRARILTQTERALLAEGEHEFEILQDTPHLLYCAGGFPGWLFKHVQETDGLEAIRAMLQTDKSVMFARLSGSGELPSLNEAIDLILEREGMVSQLLQQFGHLKSDRAVMDTVPGQLPAEVESLISHLGHYNGYGNLEAPPPSDGRASGFHRIELISPPAISEPYRLRLQLEACSAEWLEPHQRSENKYRENNLEPDYRLLLSDQEYLNQALAIEALGSSESSKSLRRTIDQFFAGDVAKFQQRWSEYYHNWWPDEFRATQDCIDQIKAWLRTQKV